MLIQKSRVGPRLHIIPGPPFIHNQANLFARVILVQHCPMHADQFFHIQRLAHSTVPGFFIKVRSASFIIPSPGMYIIMKGKPFHKPMGIPGARACIAGFQHLLCPVYIVHIRPPTDFFDGFPIAITAYVSLVTAVKVPVILRGHVAPAAPVFIAYPKIIHLPGFFMPILPAQVRHGGNALKGHIFHPFRHLLHGAASHIAVNISLAAQLPAQLKKLMGPKAVILQHTAPVGVDHLFTVLLRPYTILPVVFVRKTAPWPAEHRDPEFL